LQVTPITSISPSVIAPCLEPGLATSYHTIDSETLHQSNLNFDLTNPVSSNTGRPMHNFVDSHKLQQQQPQEMLVKHLVVLLVSLLYNTVQPS